MTWWAQHGDKIGAAAAIAVVAGFGALTRYFSKLNDKKIEAAASAPPPPAPPSASPTAQAAELESARIALRRAHLEIEDLHEALRRQRRSLDELEVENRQKSEALTEARALLESAKNENLELRRQIEGSQHGAESRRPTDDPGRDRSRGRSTGGGWPVAREEVGPQARGRIRRQGAD